jgi:hypothetical protein
VVRAYASFYQIFGTDFLTLEEIAKLTGFSLEEAELAIMDAADWLMANSPFRSLPRRCLVCDHALGPRTSPA